MGFINLYNGTVTVGMQNGDLVSMGTNVNPIDGGVLNATLNQQSDSIKLAIRCDNGYKTVDGSSVKIKATGSNSNKWAFALDNNGSPGTFTSYGGELTISSEVIDENYIIWAKARSLDSESPSTDNLTKINIVATLTVI